MTTLLLLVLYALLSNNQGLCTLELAQGKPAFLSSIHNNDWPADKAVDGNANTSMESNSCTHTGKGTVAFITVDLEATFAIHRFEVFFAHGTTEATLSLMKERGRLYSAVISHSKTIDGEPCFTDSTVNKDDFDLIQNQTCEGIGRYISLVQRKKAAGDNDPLLLVCEFKVYGCPVDYYGNHCENKCASSCRTCNPDSSRCWGCNPGWLEESCEIPCPDGNYGNNCTSTCNKCKDNLPCNKENGTCPDCDRGYTGMFCESVCRGKSYGYNCNETCGSCYGGKSCDTKFGKCTSCERGYELPLCKHACREGFYGYSCNESCGACDIFCDKRYGNCSGNACSDGYLGSMCKDKCPSGKYGRNCSQSCGNCLNGGVCDHEMGICPGSLCERGYRGDLCKTECPDGTHGYNCSQSCGFCLNKEACDKQYGVCKTPLCDPGYKGRFCKDACNEGSYGYNCSEQCGFCKNSAPCKAQDGSCPNSRCKEGYKGEECKTECDISEYGENCESECGVCKDYLCHPANGTCLNGCRFGKTPPLCTESLHQEETKDATPAVAGGIAGSFVIVLLFNAGILIFIQRRNVCARTPSDNEETAQDYEVNMATKDSNADHYTTLEEATVGTSGPYAEHRDLEISHSYVEMEQPSSVTTDAKREPDTEMAFQNEPSAGEKTQKKPYEEVKL